MKRRYFLVCISLHHALPTYFVNRRQYAELECFLSGELLDEREANRTTKAES